MNKVSFTALAVLLGTVHAATAVSKADLESIGRKVWKNECNGTVEGLTSWNAGESFPSLGIGHFIWYPKGQDGPFEESFPKLVAKLKAEGVEVPEWLSPRQDAPWSSRSEFEKDQGSARMKALRQMLVKTVPLQAEFLGERMDAALPKMIAAAPEDARENVRQQFARLRQSGAGLYALIDYVNFKGEGVKTTERYEGEGWGLLQVLQEMRGSGAGAAAEFSRAAAAVLTRRVRNSPPARNEAKWLPGWKNRVATYAE